MEVPVRPLLALSSLTLFAAGCGLACTEAGCQNGVTVELSAAWFEGAAPADVFTLSIAGDGVTAPQSCRFDYPRLVGADDACTLTESDGTVFARFGWGDPVDTFVDVALSDADGVRIAESLDVAWGDPFRPNGPGCPPVCRGAVVGLSDPG